MTTQHVSSPPPVEGAFPRPDADVAARVKALESIMIEKGLLSTEAVDKIAEMYEREVGPHLGAKVVARAWTDPEFKERLLEDASEACREMGIGGVQGEDMVVVENTPDVHNVIVCTLCSCYPKLLLGIPPAWYKSLAYRSRVVVDPRGVLDEFGLELPEGTEVRVHDSTADLRYLVLPMRPKATRGWSEQQLAAIVTRDCMIGTALPKVAPKARGTRAA